MKLRAGIAFSALLLPTVAGSQQVRGPRPRPLVTIELDAQAVVDQPTIPAVRTPRGFAVATTEHVVLEYDREGRLLRQLGRKGSGPGEYRGVAALAARGDTLLVLDAVLRRVTRITSAGAVRQTAYSPPPDARGAEPVALREGGVVFSVLNSTSPANPASLVTSLIWLSPTAERRDTLNRADLSGSVTQVSGTNGARLMLAQPFSHHDRVAFNGATGAVVVVRSPGSALSRGSSDVGVEINVGGRVHSWYTSIPAEPLRAEAIDAWLDERVPALSSHLGGPTAARRTLRSVLSLPAHLPPVQRVLLGEDGALWMLHPSRGSIANTWTVYSTEGRPACTANFAVGARPLVVSATDAWVLEEDDEGLQRIVRYRVCQ